MEAGLLARRRGKGRIAKRESNVGFLVGVLLPSLLLSGTTFFLAQALANTQVATGLAVCVLTLLILLGISSFDFDLLGHRLVWGWKLQFTPTDFQDNAAKTRSSRRRQGEVVSLGYEQRSYLGADACLAAALVVRPEGSNAHYLRAADSAEFLVYTQEGESYLVTGQLVLEGGKVERKRASARDLDSCLATLRLPSHELPSAVVEERLLCAGDHVEVAGELTAEARAEFVGAFRDGGLIPIFRGMPGNPVVVDILPRPQRSTES